MLGKYKKHRVAFATLCFLLQVTDGLEPIAVQLSGGQLLPPVQTLVATLFLLFVKACTHNADVLLYPQGGDINEHEEICFSRQAEIG